MPDVTDIITKRNRITRLIDESNYLPSIEHPTPHQIIYTLFIISLIVFMLHFHALSVVLLLACFAFSIIYQHLNRKKQPLPFSHAWRDRVPAKGIFGLKLSKLVATCIVTGWLLSSGTSFAQSLENLMISSIESGNQTDFDLALQAGADPIAWNKKKTTALKQSIMQQQFEMFTAMMSRLGSDHDAKMAFSATLPIALFRIREDSRYYEMLLARGADPFSALTGLCDRGEYARAEVILNRLDVDPARINTFNLPMKIVTNAYLQPRHLEKAVELLKTLKKIGVSMDQPDHRGDRATQKALQLKLPELLEVVDVKGAFTNERAQLTSPSLERRLFDAVENNDLAAAQSLLQKKADPNGVNDGVANRNTPMLSIAAAKGHIGMIELLLQQGAKLNQPSGTQRPLSDFALRQVYEYSGASLGAKDEEKAEWQTKRDEALRVIDYLLAQGLDINSRAVNGMTALHRAAGEYDPFVLEYLLKNGADPNPRLSNGVTPLLIALEKSNLAAVKLLLKYGADPLLADKDGKTAADRAYQLKEVAVLRLLNPEKQHAAFVKEYTPVANSPLIATWSNGESGFKTILLHFEESGQGGMVNAIGIEFRFIWKADRHGEVTLLFPPQRQLDVEITGTGPQQEQLLQGSFDPGSERLTLQFNGKQMATKATFRKVGETWEQLRAGGGDKRHEPAPEERLASALKQMQRNHSFYLPGAGLPNWPAQLFRNTQLKKLSLEKNRLTSIPDAIGSLGELGTLEAPRNDIGRISPAIGKLKKLKTLNLMGNRIEHLPIELGSLSLKNLNLGDNWIASMPKGLRFSEKIESLDLSDNRLQQIGLSLTGCQKLRSLQLGQNELVQIHGDLKNLHQLRTLNLSFNRLQQIPTALTTLPALEWLTITNNRINILPATFGKLVSIKNLMLASNRLQSLPGSIKQLSNLSSLDVSNNRLISLPAAIGHLVALETLDLSRNQVTTLPDEVTGLKKLTTLNISKNRISTLPDNLTGLKSLKSIDLSFNNFEAMPFQLGQLPNLWRLNIRGNKIPKKQIKEFKAKYPKVRFM